MVRLTDQQISELIAEIKQLPSGFRQTLLQKMKEKGVHRQSEVRVDGRQGHVFYITVRQSILNPLDFSVILSCELQEKPDVSREKTGRFHLRRYNGKSHLHTNKLDGDRFRDFHVHYATERYQAAGYAEESYAQPAESYSSLGDALQRLIEECHCELPPDEPPPLL